MPCQPMKRNSHHFKRRPTSSDTDRTILGTLSHTMDDMLILRLSTKDVPYPNAAVFFGKKVGAVDEVFGKLDEMYCSVKGLAGCEGRDGVFMIDRNRFIRRDRLSGETGSGQGCAVVKKERVDKKESVGQYNFRIKKKNKKR